MRGRGRQHGRKAAKEDLIAGVSFRSRHGPAGSRPGEVSPPECGQHSLHLPGCTPGGSEIPKVCAGRLQHLLHSVTEFVEAGRRLIGWRSIHQLPVGRQAVRTPFVFKCTQDSPVCSCRVEHGPDDAVEEVRQRTPLAAEEEVREGPGRWRGNVVPAVDRRVPHGDFDARRRVDGLVIGGVDPWDGPVHKERRDRLREPFAHPEVPQPGTLAGRLPPDGVREGGHGTCLQDVDLAGVVHCPFDVLGAAEMQCHRTGGGSDRRRALLRQRTSVAAGQAGQAGQAGTGHPLLAGGHARYQVLGQSGHCRNEGLVAGAGQGIGGECHACRDWHHHLLHQDRHPRIGRNGRTIAGDGQLIRPDALRACRVKAAMYGRRKVRGRHLQVGFVHTGEGSSGQVLRGSRGPDGKGAGAGAGRCRPEQPGQIRRCRVVQQRGLCDNKPGGHPEARRGEGREGRRLAADSRPGLRRGFTKAEERELCTHRSLQPDRVLGAFSLVAAGSASQCTPGRCRTAPGPHRLACPPAMGTLK